MQKRSLRGFSLVELAIAFLIISVIMGAIWLAAGSVRGRQQADDAIATIIEIADRVHSLFGANPGATNLPDTMTKQISAGIMPKQVQLDSSTTISQWGGDVLVGFKRYNNWLVGFTVKIGLSNKIPVTARNQACLDIVNHFRPAGHAAAGFTTSNDVPVADYPLPNEDISPGDDPVYAYAGGSSWTNVSNMSLSDLTAAFGSGGCEKVALYFKL